jgi:crotonobetainyl-CoA:carnitine CoA-transferase CaiB-like acyl-CoA transferase
LTTHFFSDQVPQPQGNSHLLLCPLDIVQSVDERIAIAAPSNTAWQIIAEAIGRLEMASDRRFADDFVGADHRSDLLAVVRSRQLDHRRRGQLRGFAMSRSPLEVPLEPA